VKRKHKKRINRAKELRKLKKLGWKLMSIAVRLKEKRCIICGSTKDLQAGHCNHVGRLHGGHLLDYSFINIHSECKICNFNQDLGRGVEHKFGEIINERYGKGTVEELKRQARQTCILTSEWLENKIVELKEIIQKESTQ